MQNTTHIVETGLLILVAYLIGCVVGYLVRRMAQPGRKPEATKVEAEATTVSAGPPLVTAPTIAPIPGARPRTPAERLAAAAGRSPIPEPEAAPAATAPSPPPPPPPPVESVIILGPPPPAPAAVLPPAEPQVIPVAEVLQSPLAPETIEAIAMEPTRTAGEATAGTVVPPSIEPPAAPPVESEAPVIPVAAAEAPPSDRGAHVVDEPATAPTEPPSVIILAPSPGEDDEAAAMRAIEGSWTPRRAARTPTQQRPVPHPEQTIVADVDNAMESARTAVAAAAAAAAAAIAEANERPRRLAPEPQPEVFPEPPGLDFETYETPAPQSFLAGTSSVGVTVRSDLDFEPRTPAHHGFGRPEGLAEARDGRPDNLKQIKGITPQLEGSLNGLGVFHYDQIAGWDQKAIVWVDNHLSLRGKIVKDKWLEQARDLSRGRGHTARPVRR